MAGCVLAGWLAPGVAAADVLPPLTPECPEGSVARKDHTGAYCEPTTCDPDQGCGKEQSCRRVAMCVETERFHPLRAGAGEQLRRIARGPCEADGSCARPAVCESTPRCVPGASATGWRSKVGCAVAPVGAVGAVGAVDAGGCGGLALGGVLAVMAAARKRRRRRDAGV